MGDTGERATDAVRRWRAERQRRRAAYSGSEWLFKSILGPLAGVVVVLVVLGLLF